MFLVTDWRMNKYSVSDLSTRTNVLLWGYITKTDVLFQDKKKSWKWYPAFLSMYYLVKITSLYQRVTMFRNFCFTSIERITYGIIYVIHYAVRHLYNLITLLGERSKVVVFQYANFHRNLSFLKFPVLALFSCWWSFSDITLLELAIGRYCFVSSPKLDCSSCINHEVVISFRVSVVAQTWTK